MVDPFYSHGLQAGGDSMKAVWRAFFVSSVILLVLLGFSMPYVEPGTATYVISVVSFAMVSVILVGSAAFIYFDWNPFDELFVNN